MSSHVGNRQWHTLSSPEKIIKIKFLILIDGRKQKENKKISLSLFFVSKTAIALQFLLYFAMFKNVQFAVNCGEGLFYIFPTIPR
jgi:hypothetical protein